jgi:flavin-dependent dehydrogenase
VASAEVLIVGAGPAGCAAALSLAPLRRTLLVERRPEAVARIGESLPPVAGRLLADMGLLKAFECQGHARCHGLRSFWGGPMPSERHGMRDPDGPGWHLDRLRFDRWLRDVAVARGADLLAPASLTAVTPVQGGWLVRLATPAGERLLEVPMLIDAGGRRAGLARRLGARRRVLDRLVCVWTHGRVALPERHAGVG